MRTVFSAAAALAALAVAPMAVANADDSASKVINDLQSQGYNVIVDRVGSKSLDNCKVTGVRNPKTLSRPAKSDERDDLNTPTVVLRQTITVSLNCS